MPIPGNVLQESFGGGTVEAEKEEREVLTEAFKEERNASSNARLREGRGGVLWVSSSGQKDAERCCHWGG